MVALQRRESILRPGWLETYLSVNFAKNLASRFRFVIGFKAQLLLYHFITNKLFPCSGKLAKAPEYFEDLFCNLSCFQEYRIRTSQRALREVCAHILVNTKNSL